MEGDRTATAMARIRAAADRIEACSRMAGNAGAAAEMRQRHAALHAEAGSALRELDALIADMEG